MVSLLTPCSVVLPPLSPTKAALHGGAHSQMAASNWRPFTQWLVSPAATTLPLMIVVAVPPPLTVVLVPMDPTTPPAARVVEVSPGAPVRGVVVSVLETSGAVSATALTCVGALEG